MTFRAGYAVVKVQMDDDEFLFTVLLYKKPHVRIIFA